MPSSRSISRHSRHSRAFRSHYFSAIGHRSYLALGAYNHPFTLHYQTALLVLPACVRACHPLRATLQRRCLLPSQLAKPLPAGLLQVRSPLLPESPLFSSPPFIDMLKSKGFPQTMPAIRARGNAAVVPRYRMLPRSSSSPVPIDPSSALLHTYPLRP